MIFLPGNDFLEDSPYEPVNSRLSDISLLAPIMGESNICIPSFHPLFGLRLVVKQLGAVHAPSCVCSFYLSAVCLSLRSLSPRPRLHACMEQL